MRHLQAHNVTLRGELPPEQLDIDTQDETERVEHPMAYDLEIQLVEGGLLAQGNASLELECQCVRCLKPFHHTVMLSNWTRHFVLEGDDAVPVVNDLVDLTPYIREDILLEFPQHPLCDSECSGLPGMKLGQAENPDSANQPAGGSSAWDQLNKLKL